MELLKNQPLFDQQSQNIIDQQLSYIEEDRKDKTLRPADVLNYGRETLEELLENGYPIVFTVPEEYRDSVLQNGLTLNETHIPGFRALAGTIGIPPFLPEEYKRFMVILDPEMAKKHKIQPRFTGPKSLFQGVVISLNKIPISDLRVLESSNEISKEVSDQQEEIKNQIKLAS